MLFCHSVAPISNRMTPHVIHRCSFTHLNLFLQCGVDAGRRKACTNTVHKYNNLTVANSGTSLDKIMMPAVSKHR